MATIVGDFPRINAERAIREPAIIEEQRAWVWPEIDDRVNALTNALRSEFRCGEGDRIGVLSRNNTSCLEVMFAASRGNLIHTSLNIRHHLTEMMRQIDDADVQVLFVGPEYVDAGRALQAQRPSLRLVGLDQEYEQLLAAASHHPVPSHGDADAVYSLAYTSGSTGESKGVPVTSRNEITCGQTVHWCFEARHDDILLNILPLFHRGGQYMSMTCAQYGLPMVLGAEANPTWMLESIGRHRISIILVVPTILKMMVETLEKSPPGRYDLSSLVLVGFGSAPSDPDLLRRFRKFAHTSFCQMAGMSEGCMTSCLTRRDYEEILANDSVLHRVWSVGRACPGIRIGVVNEADEFLPDGETGEFVYQGDPFVYGYWGKKEESIRAWNGGWFHSGDIGRRDKDGYVYYLDRKFGRIMTGAETVYAREVEDAIRPHPKVADVAVVGLPDPHWGEAVTAVIVLSSDATKTGDLGYGEIEQELRSFAHEQGLARYKLPKRTVFVDELPKTALGKTAYQKVKDIAISRRDPTMTS
jgi:acyl-CoA synthetase (AMP-forming)/AMP-acid ligase II